MKGLVRTGARASLCALAFALTCTPLAAQSLQTPTATAESAENLPPTENADQVSFAADALDYDDDSQIVTATGDVRMLRNGSRLRADKVVWNRTTGDVNASGNVAVINPGGDTVYGDNAHLTDDMKDGIVQNLLLVLADGGRLAAKTGTRKGDIVTLDHSAYTPCRVETESGCPKEPSWKITALRIVHDDKRHRIYYKDARFHFFGVPVLWLPTFSHPDGSNRDKGAGGFLLPNFQISSSTGFELDLPFYWRMAPNRDFTITPHVFTKELPAIEGLYRQLDDHGAFQIRAMGTYASVSPAVVGNVIDTTHGFRGFIDADGTYQFGSHWTLHGQLRLETDRTFMKRYDISADDRLRSVLEADRIDHNSMLTIAGWYVQTVRTGESMGQEPIALPAIDYRRRFKDPWLGGVFQAQVNSLALSRTEGQDTQRVFASLQWDLRKLTPMGQEVTFTAYARADGYHTGDIMTTTTPSYRGLPGWQGRGIAAVAVDVRWPLIGALWNGVQQIAPRIQFVGTPPTKNLTLPDEDSRAVDLEDTNLFALNRFSGYDRWEDASRVTYGLEWTYQRPKVDISAEVGQSYRLASRPTILLDGTGLTDRFSDYVGRMTVKYGPWIEVTERIRLDKEKLKLRRNEIDATFGSKKTYVLVGYLLLNRNIDTSIEDLHDEQEIRLGARVQLLRYWSIYGSTVIDLTTIRQDPASLSDGFQPVRNRIGVTYEDECLSLGLTWRRDYDPIAGARHGSTFSLRLALKNIGR